MYIKKDSEIIDGVEFFKYVKDDKTVLIPKHKAIIWIKNLGDNYQDLVNGLFKRADDSNYLRIKP